jgi:ketosteroid isomerase-like protein
MIRKLNLLSAGALAALTLAACDKAAAPVDTAKEAAAIEAQMGVLNAALKAGDAERSISIDAKDVHIYAGGPDILSREDDLKFSKAMVADPNGALAVKPEHTEVSKSGDVAFQYGSWTGAATDPKTGKKVATSGHWVAGWRKAPEDGSWRLAALSAAEGSAAAAAK